MHTWLRCTTRVVALSITAATLLTTIAATQARVASPDGRNQVTVEIHDGGLYYSLNRDTHPLFLPSRLGMAFRNAPPLLDSLRITDTTRSTHDETWTQPWGEVARVRDHHNELRVSVVETASPGRRFTVAFRVFDDGVGFRYEFPEQPGLGEFAITDELTEFTLEDDARAWWIPSNRPRLDRSEMLFSESPVSVLDSVQTPLTLETRDGRTFVVIHEGHLVGDAYRHDDVELGAQARRHHGEHETLHRFRGGERPGRRARRRLERRLGRRLDPEPQRLLVHKALS